MIKKNKEGRKKLILGIFIVFLMASSGLAMWKGGEKSQNMVFSEGKYWLKVDDSYFYFDYLEKDIEDISLEVHNIFGSKVVLGGDVEEENIVKLERIFIFKNILPVRTNFTDCNSEDINVIFREGEDRVYMDGTCIVLEGDEFKVSDRFGYWLLEDE